MKVLNMYDQDLLKVKEELQKIKEQGFDAVKVSSVQSLPRRKEAHWYDYYQPISLNIGNRIARPRDVYELCNEAEKAGVDVIVQTVVNQFNMENSIPQKYIDYEARDIDDWNNRQKVLNGSLPGLDKPLIYNSEYQSLVLGLLNNLFTMGVKGVEIHGAKQIALPEDYEYIKEGDIFFWKKVRELCEKKGTYAIAELAFTDPELIHKYLKYVKAITNWSSAIPHEMDCLTYVENDDSFEHKRTTVHSDFTINEKYYDLQKEFPSTEYCGCRDAWKRERVKAANQM